MGASQRTSERASRYGLAERDVRALTEHLQVLDDVGRARDGEHRYLVVSQSGREYLVDAEQGTCECDDYRYREVECKHLRRVAFATGRRPIPAAAVIDLDVDPTLGDRVGGEIRFASTDGGDGNEASDRTSPTEQPGAADATPAETWIVRDRDRGTIREFDSRGTAERAVADMEDLGVDVELLPPAPEREETEQTRRPELPGGAREQQNTPSVTVPATASVAVPVASDDVDAGEYEFERRTVADDPVEWLPDAFVDWIDGTPAINRKGFEVLAHFYGVSVESDVAVSPVDADFEYAQVEATAIMPDGRRAEAQGTAHVDRGDDPGILLELADTRARKRAISIATGVGTVAVEELKQESERI